MLAKCVWVWVWVWVRVSTHMSVDTWHLVSSPFILGRFREMKRTLSEELKADLLLTCSSPSQTGGTGVGRERERENEKERGREAGVSIYSIPAIAHAGVFSSGFLRRCRCHRSE